MGRGEGRGEKFPEALYIPTNAIFPPPLSDSASDEATTTPICHALSVSLVAREK